MGVKSCEEKFTILTAKHVLGEENRSKIGQFKLGFIGNEVVLLKCVKETDDNADLAFLEIVNRFDWEKSVEIKNEENKINSSTYFINEISSVDINSSVFCYGYPSILLHESDFGDPKE